MAAKTFFFLSILLTAIVMAGGMAHLFELPNKVHLPADDYLTVQQIYRGWALLGIPLCGALISAVTLTILLRGAGTPFYLALLATLCIAVSLAVFFSVTFPINKATQNWTTLPGN